MRFRFRLGLGPVSVSVGTGRGSRKGSAGAGDPLTAIAALAISVAALIAMLLVPPLALGCVVGLVYLVAAPMGSVKRRASGPDDSGHAVRCHLLVGVGRALLVRDRSVANARWRGTDWPRSRNNCVLGRHDRLRALPQAHQPEIR